MSPELHTASEMGTQNLKIQFSQNDQLASWHKYSKCYMGTCHWNITKSSSGKAIGSSHCPKGQQIQYHHIYMEDAQDQLGTPFLALKYISDLYLSDKLYGTYKITNFNY